MDLDKFRKLSQEGQTEKEKQILQLCNPQQIAEQLMKDLEINATKCAKDGKREATAHFFIWNINWGGYQNSNMKRIEEGPLAKIKSDELSKILFSMIQKYITDSNIKLELNNWTNLTDSHICCDKSVLNATLSW